MLTEHFVISPAKRAQRCKAYLASFILLGAGVVVVINQQDERRTDQVNTSVTADKADPGKANHTNDTWEEKRRTQGV